MSAVVPKEQPLKPAIDVWVEGMDVLREFVDLIEQVSALTIRENDVIVVKVRHHLSQQTSDELLENLHAVFGEDRKFVILDQQVDIAIISPELDADEGPEQDFVRRLDKADFPGNLTGAE